MAVIGNQDIVREHKRDPPPATPDPLRGKFNAVNLHSLVHSGSLLRCAAPARSSERGISNILLLVQRRCIFSSSILRQQQVCVVGDHLALRPSQRLPEQTCECGVRRRLLFQPRDHLTDQTLDLGERIVTVKALGVTRCELRQIGRMLTIFLTASSLAKPPRHESTDRENCGNEV